jgi:hypothetical protein
MINDLLKLAQNDLGFGGYSAFHTGFNDKFPSDGFSS